MNYIKEVNEIFELEEQGFVWFVDHSKYVLMSLESSANPNDMTSIHDLFREVKKILEDNQPTISFARIDLANAPRIVDHYKIKTTPRIYLFVDSN